MKSTVTAGRSSENGGRFVGGHFAGGHDGMANLCKPIAAYDFHVRYNKILYLMLYPYNLSPSKQQNGSRYCNGLSFVTFRGSKLCWQSGGSSPAAGGLCELG